MSEKDDILIEAPKSEETTPKEEQRTQRLEQFADGGARYTWKTWLSDAAHRVGATILFMLLGVTISVRTAWDWISAAWTTAVCKIREVWGEGKVSQDAVAGHIPRWLSDARREKAWADNAIAKANPGTLISCHDCPFRRTEQEAGAVAGVNNGWTPWEEQAAIQRISERYHSTLPVCGHPANGKWGPARCGAHTPDEDTCPRALLANMNPLRRAWWKWRMKKHLKRHGQAPKML